MHFFACGGGIKWLLTWAPTQHRALPVRGQVSRLWACHRHCGGNFHAPLGKHFPGHIFQLHWEAGPTGNQPPSNNHPGACNHTRAHTHTIIHIYCHTHAHINRLVSPFPLCHAIPAHSSMSVFRGMASFSPWQIHTIHKHTAGRKSAKACKFQIPPKTCFLFSILARRLLSKPYCLTMSTFITINKMLTKTRLSA